MRKNLVVVDTVGGLELIHDDYFNNLPMVNEWHGHEREELADTIPHPHGGFAMQQALMPLWQAPEEDEIHAHFVRIFDSKCKHHKMSAAKWCTDIVAEIAKTGKTWVNCSWGTYIGSNIPSQSARADRWRTVIAARDVTVLWAAGNGGDFDPDVDENLPSGLLTDCSHKIAAAYPNGDTARFSSDSTHAPPLATFWSVAVKGHNPVTAQWQDTTGTSFASPKATGIAVALDLDYQGLMDFAIDKSVTPKDYPGETPHPKWGYGWLEFEYQKLIRNCPNLCPNAEFQTMGFGDSWFDFEKE